MRTPISKDAVRRALDILKRNLLQAGETHHADFPDPVHDKPADGETREVSKKNHWGFVEMGYSLEMEMTHGNILHSVSKGFMKETHIPMIEKCRREAFESIQPDGRIDYFVASVGELVGSSPKARILYMSSLKRWHELHPFKMVISYGANRFLRTATNLARPFMPFKVRTAGDLNSALEMVALDNRGPTDDVAGREDGSTGFESVKGIIKEHYVEELIAYIAQMRWDSEGRAVSWPSRSSNPLNPVFDAVFLIKSELDELLKERETANEALKKARDELERRVAERTRDLILINRKLRETQSQLIQSAKLASIGELAAGVAHELNQPLTVIRGLAQMSKRSQRAGVLVASDLTEHLTTIEKNTRRMINIINHLRTFSRQSHTDFHPVDVNAVVEDSFLMVGEQLRVRNIEVKKDMDKALPKVHADANQLEQVFLNLIANARDAIETRNAECGMKTPNSEFRKGKIGIITRMRSVEHGMRCVKILVQDNGCGIPTDTVDRIFDPFFTTKEVGKGTGLGLSISYGIIKEHHGEIEVSEYGPEGTTFRIRLPILESNNHMG